MGADDVRGAAEVIMFSMMLALSVGGAAMLEKRMRLASSPQSSMMCFEIVEARAAVIAPDQER